METESFIGESIDCFTLGEGTIIDVVNNTAKIYLEEFDQVIDLPLDEILAEDEEVEELDELSKKTLGNYIKGANYSTKVNTRWAARTGDRDSEAIVRKREAGIGKAADKLAKEEVELEEGQNKPYVKPHMDSKGSQSGWKASNKHGNVKFFGKEFKNAAEKHAGIKEETEDLKELSKKTLASYVDKATTSVHNSAYRAGKSEGQGKGYDTENLIKSISRQSKINKAANKLAKEEVELEEARGRPPKQPKEGEKPTAAWKRHQERKDKGEEQEEFEALGAQLRKAASINKPVTFTNGDKAEVSSHHINKFWDHMDAREGKEKHTFQNAAQKSHSDFKNLVSQPVPKKETGKSSIVKYR